MTLATVDQDRGGFEDAGTLVVEAYFAIVPEWVIDVDISDAAYPRYSDLLRYGQWAGTRMPSRALLARRLKKRSVDSVDRVLKELVGIGAVVVERRRREAGSAGHAKHAGLGTVAGASPPKGRPVGCPVRGAGAARLRAVPLGHRPWGWPRTCAHPWPRRCGDPDRLSARQRRPWCS